MDPVNLTANWKELGAEQLAQLKEEVRLSRDGATRHGTVTRVPYLPSYSGDKGIDFKHYVSAIESISMSNNDAQVIQAIRKSVTGSAAQVIGILDYTTSKAEIVKQLQTNFGSITDTAASWQKFYAATQSTKESLVEWRTRVHQLYAKTENDSNNDLHLKTKLINGLQNQKLREQVFWKSEDITATEEDLFRLLRKLTEKSSTASTNPSVNTISAEESMKKEIESLRAQVASFTTKSEDTEKEKPKDKNGKRHDSNDKEPQKRMTVISQMVVLGTASTETTIVTTTAMTSADTSIEDPGITATMVTIRIVMNTTVTMTVTSTAEKTIKITGVHATITTVIIDVRTITTTTIGVPTTTTVVRTHAHTAMTTTITDSMMENKRDHSQDLCRMMTNNVDRHQDQRLEIAYIASDTTTNPLR